MRTTTRNLEAIPGFDAVAESRKWREATSRLLNSMDREERLAYLNQARERYLASRMATAAHVNAGEGAGVLREEPQKLG